MIAAARLSTPVRQAPPLGTAQRMAEFITRHVASNGSVDRDDLLLEFTAQEIDGQFETAKRLARNAGRGRR